MLSVDKIEYNRKYYIDTVKSTFECDTSPLLQWLETTDFWDAPASTNYHDNYRGGLVEHHLTVYKELLAIDYSKLLNLPTKSVARTALLHDLCKINFYQKQRKNKKMDDGKWVSVEQYGVNDQFPAGHGEKSVIVALQHGIPLSDDEILAIRWHMGAWGPESKDYVGGLALSGAMSKSRLVVALQLADMISTYLQ